MGAVNGCFYLAGFLLLQTGVKKYGVVLSSVFMKLGLLVPILVITITGLWLFRERLSRRQWLAVAIILLALVLLNI